MKKLMFVAVLLVTFNLVFIGVNAEELVWGDYTYKLNGEYSSDELQDGISITEYNGTESIVIIPSEIDGLQVKRIYFSAFYKNEYIQEVYIPEGVEYIYGDAFYGCTNLKEVYIPEEVKYVGLSAFYQCTNLKKVNLPQTLPYVCSFTFRYCDSLKEIIIPESVTSLGNGAFSQCENLETVVLYNPNTEIAEDDPLHFEIVQNRKRLEPIFSALPVKYVKRIYSFSGGSVEEYARKYGIEFVPIANVLVNNIELYSDMPSYIENDRTLVPMRAIFEALGAEVSWDDETKTAIGLRDGVKVKITIGENVLYKNGEAIELDCAAEITNDRTMVPVRAISEAFGCTVEWNDETKTVEITN